MAIWSGIISGPALDQDFFSHSNEIVRFGSHDATILSNQAFGASILIVARVHFL